MTAKEMRLAYPEDLIQQIGQYLVTRPYAEVAHLVPRLQLHGVKVETDIEVQAQEESDNQPSIKE